MDEYFYIKGFNGHPVNCLGEVIADDTGKKVEKRSGMDLQALREAHGDVVLGTEQQLMADVREARKLPPREIPRHRFNDMLYCMPPCHAGESGGVYSFKFDEHAYQDLTHIFAESKGQFWEFCDSVDLTHAEVAERIHAAEREKALHEAAPDMLEALINAIPHLLNYATKAEAKSGAHADAAKAMAARKKALNEG